MNKPNLSWSSLSVAEKKEFLDKWLQKTLKDETPESLKQHIIKHAHEISDKPPLLWSASMHNLLVQFDKMFKINLDIDAKLERVNHKYNQDTKRYTAPPKVKIASRHSEK
tara:strand:+ start:225 stop:554 length:330 start_codon:yes stop_codon:yes gene_type:complete